MNHDKQLFTSHAKKRDYMMSKSIVCAFAMACMRAAYLIVGLGAGLSPGASMDVNFGSMLVAVFCNIIMSFGWASLYSFIHVVLRRHFGVSITLSFLIGTGIPVIGTATLLGSCVAKAAVVVAWTHLHPGLPGSRCSVFQYPSSSQRQDSNKTVFGKQ